jgi:hypothetical protein
MYDVLLTGMTDADSLIASLCQAEYDTFRSRSILIVFLKSNSLERHIMRSVRSCCREALAVFALQKGAVAFLKIV